MSGPGRFASGLAFDVPVGAAGAEALSRYDEEQLPTILDFLQTARQVQERQAARLGAGGG
ncbi:hypothetical protein [Streptomyces sp. NBC_01481]|uniref:hypothetical protein n=1 Tax=Streptomyces sp. NBC_01481 TaxID=2975869 RepID=UPI00225285C9|nr:hypothetical protein [Streptomyces sp. NBC_01481]MCX4581783.1 hypothetical protein [Streptomyces sp. NBC_01481]